MQKQLLGKEVTTKLREKITTFVSKAQNKFTLAIVLVGDDPASIVYKNRLVKLAESLNISTTVEILDISSDTSQVVQLIEKLNKNPEVNGILPMLPFPKHINNDAIVNVIDINKDVDCISPLSVGMLYLGKNLWAPCTPRAVMEIIKYYAIDLEGKNVVIIGRSNVVGKPLIPLLLAQNATVTVCHSKTKDLNSVTSAADVLIVAIGSPKFVTKDMVKEGAIVIDVGINALDGSVVGDVDEAACEKTSQYTPVPGGVGPVSAMMVIETMLSKTDKNFKEE